MLAATIGATLSNHDTPLAVAMAVGVAAATGVGLVLGLVTALLSVPAWAVTLGGAAIVEAAVLGATQGQITLLRSEVGSPSVLWFLLFVILTLGGGALWMLPLVRATLSTTRDNQPVGKWAGWRAGVGAIAGLTGSGLVAGLAGVAYALRLHAAPPISSGSSLTLVALAVALLGGISVFGRRGGVAGVLLATVLIGSVQQILALHAVESWVVFLVTGVALLIGLLASRLTESLAGSD